jgi:hypothetical protein
MKELLERTEQLREQVEEKHQQGADTAAATLLSLFLKLPIHPSVNKRSALKVLSSYFIGYGPLACKSTCRHILLFSPWFHSTQGPSHLSLICVNLYLKTVKIKARQVRCQKKWFASRTNLT